MEQKLTEQDIWRNTPCFVLDQSDLARNLQYLQKALKEHWPNSLIGYSYKTCAIPWLLRFMRKENIYAEVVSPEELQLAQKIGNKLEQIIYNGPIKTKETLQEALLNQAIVNLDSQREVFWTKEIAQSAEQQIINVGLRVNFDIESKCQGETVSGKKGNRFGFSYEKEDFKHAIHILQATKNIRITGLHMHVSSITRSAKLYQVLAEQALQIADEYGLSLSYIDIGGGFFAGGEYVDRFDQYIKVIADVLKKRYQHKDLTLIVEPGASLIASPISLYSRVLDVKENYLEKIVVTDASRCLIDPFMHKTNYRYDHILHENNHCLQQSLVDYLPEPLYQTSNERERKTVSAQTIGGYTCMENDRLMHVQDVCEMRCGDGIIYHEVGSYSLCFNPLFIKYFPAIYLKNGDTYTLIRRNWTYQDYLIGDLTEDLF